MDILPQSIQHVCPPKTPTRISSSLTILAQGTGEGLWEEAYTYAKGIVAQLSIDEKVNVTITTSDSLGCSAFTGGVPRLGLPGMCFNDAESGVRVLDQSVSGFPAQISIGASWNRTLAYDRGNYIGAEFKAKGINTAFGPVIGPLGRVALGGRNWEGTHAYFPISRAGISSKRSSLYAF